MADDDRIVFTRRSADRIANAVRTVEGLQDPAAGLTFEGPRTQDSRSRGGVFRMCTFSGTWNIDTAKTLVFRGVTSTPNTVVAYNLFSSLAASTATDRACAIARDGTAWYLVAARCP